MKILVLWAGPASPNLGVRVLGEGIEAALHSAFGPNISITHRDFGAGPVSYGGRALLREIVSVRGGAISADLRKYDLVVDSGGGDSLTDIYGLKRLLNIVLVQRIANRGERKLILAPQTIGPFNSRFAKWLGRSALRNADLVLARDPESFSVVKEMSTASAALSTDVVFNLPVPTPREREGVILNVSGLLYRGSALVGQESYQTETRRLIETLIERGMRVTLLPHVLDGSPTDNDVVVARELHDEYSSRGVELYVPQNLSDARNKIAGAELLIGARMHACLNALSVGVPAVALAYSRKFAPLMRAVGWNVVIDLKDEPGFANAVVGLLDNSLPSAESVRFAAAEQSKVFVGALQELMEGASRHE